MPEDPLLELHALNKRFGGLLVTDNVSLTVVANEIHAIIGSNLPRALKRNPDVVR